jgi:hypothetical protein
MTWLRGLTLVTAFAIAAIGMIPLRAALGITSTPKGLAIANATGTIWNGRIIGVSWHGIALGDFDVAISPLDLLSTPALHLDNGSGPLRSAVLRSSDTDLHVSDANITVRIADMIRSAPSDLAARIANGSLTLNNGRCTHATGRLDMPAAMSVGLPALTGSFACDQGVIVAQLSSDAGQITLELGPALDRVAYRSAPPTLEIALPALGIPRAR